MSYRIRITLLAACLLTFLGAASTVQAQLTSATGIKNPSPELVGKLTKELSITPDQAIGGSGALFGLAKTKLKPEEFTKVADAVPGMDGLLKAAPKPKAGGAAGALATMGGALPGKAGGIASLAGSFKTLGLSPDMIGKFVPIMTQFVNVKGGAQVANILGGVLK